MKYVFQRIVELPLFPALFSIILIIVTDGSWLGCQDLLAISAVCIKAMTVCQKWKCLMSSDTQPRHWHFKWFFFYHLFFQHPYIYPPSFTTCNSEGIITVRNFLMNGTLRDSLCNVSRFHFWIFTSLGNHLILASSYTMRFRAPCITFNSSPLGLKYV